MIAFILPLFLTVHSVLTAPTSSVLTAPTSSNLNGNTRIVNGGGVNNADFPWMGSWKGTYGSHICGCVFVGARYVLTAGHCAGNSGNLVQFGSVFSMMGGKFPLRRVTRHPDYGHGAGFVHADITVGEAEGLISGGAVSPATLPEDASNPGGEGWIVGWGKMCADCGSSLMLQGAEIPFMADDACEEFWGEDVSRSTHICVYDKKATACSGDSGGPLTQEDTVYGLASWVNGECLPEFPAVYTRVGAYRSWVCDQTDGLAKGC